MKQIILAVMLTLALSPAYAMTHKEKREHAHRVHKEFAVLKSWMAESEEQCAPQTGTEFHDCYIKTMKELHAKHKTKFLPETEKAYRYATRIKHNTIID